jgi:hypothetical protein
MTIHRAIRSLISLAAAYGIVCALVLGSIAAGRVAALPAPICNASKTSDPGSTTAPLSRDLACLVAGCCGCAAPGFAPPAVANIALPSIFTAAWQGFAKAQSAPDYFGFAEARAPPALV